MSRELQGGMYKQNIYKLELGVEILTQTNSSSLGFGIETSWHVSGLRTAIRTPPPRE